MHISSAKNYEVYIRNGKTVKSSHFWGKKDQSSWRILYLGLEQITYKISFKNSVGKSWIT